MKIVINTSFAPFRLSDKVLYEIGYDKKSGLTLSEFLGQNELNENQYEYRANPKLIAAIEKIGLRESEGRFNSIKIVEIPDDVEWIIQNEDYCEWIAEKHRRWW